MRRIASIFLLLLSAAITASVVAAGDDKPKAMPLEPIKDFEIVAKGEVIVHEFEIKNEGNAPLELTDVRPACGCTVASFDKVIEPGAVGKVRARVKTENFNGPIAKSIAVFTNDPETPKIQLVVKAKVKPFVAVAPGFARYSYVQGERVLVSHQTLWAEDSFDIEILEVKVPYDHLEVSYREATEEERTDKSSGRQWRLEFNLDPYSPIGALREYVEIKLNHPKQKIVKIPVSGFVRPRQHVTPDKVDFGQLEKATLPLQRTLHFTNFITKTIELTKVETGFEGISAEIKSGATDTGYRFQLVLTVSPDVPQGPFSSTVKIHTTDEKNPIVELPIKGTIL